MILEEIGMAMITGLIVGLILTAVMWVTLPLMEKRLKIDERVGKATKAFSAKIDDVKGFANDVVHSAIDEAKANINVNVAKVEDRVSNVAGGIMTFADNKLKEVTDEIHNSIDDVITNRIRLIVENATTAIDSKISYIFEDAIPELIDEQKKEIAEMIPQMMTMGTAAIAAAIKTDRFSEIGAKGAQQRQVNKAESAAKEQIAIAAIESKVPKMGATIWGMVPENIRKLAMDNPEMVMAIVDKFTKGDGGKGGFGSPGGGGQFNPGDWK